MHSYLGAISYIFPVAIYMFKLMDKKIIAILCRKSLLNWPYLYATRYCINYIFSGAIMCYMCEVLRKKMKKEK